MPGDRVQKKDSAIAPSLQKVSGATFFPPVARDGIQILCSSLLRLIVCLRMWAALATGVHIVDSAGTYQETRKG